MRVRLWRNSSSSPRWKLRRYIPSIPWRSAVVQARHFSHATIPRSTVGKASHGGCHMSWTHRNPKGSVSSPSRFKQFLKTENAPPPVPEIRRRYFKAEWCINPRNSYDVTDNANTPRTHRRTFHCTQCLSDWRKQCDLRLASSLASSATIAKSASGDRMRPPFRLCAMVKTQGSGITATDAATSLSRAMCTKT